MNDETLNFLYDTANRILAFSKEQGYNPAEKTEKGDVPGEKPEAVMCISDDSQKNCGEICIAHGDGADEEDYIYCRRNLYDTGQTSTDWREILHDFLEIDRADYSLCPPDRRFTETDFFLPDLNEPDIDARDVLFMIDVSGSMNDHSVSIAYNEVLRATEILGDKLHGWLGFFTTGVIPPIPFDNGTDIRKILPKGTGGTDFGCVFDYVRREMRGNMPAYIIMVTDGEAPFPQEKAAMGIPVLWLLTEEGANPPWGRVAVIKDK